MSKYLTDRDRRLMEKWDDELKWFRHHGFEIRPECIKCHYARKHGDDFKRVDCPKLGLRAADDWCRHFKLFNASEPSGAERSPRPTTPDNP